MELEQYDFQKPVNDYLRVMADTPEVAIADPAANAVAITASYERARLEQAELLALPELSLTGYSAADMFFNRRVLDEANTQIEALAALTLDGPAMVIGAPLEHDGVLYNCAAFLAGGRVAGVVPKSFLPNYNEFYENRWFTSGVGVEGKTIRVGGQEVPFGTDLLFELNGKKIGVEICEDAWAPITPSAHAALGGAEVIVNLSASNELIGKTEYRRDIITNLASKLMCAYIYASSGIGESTADVVYGGHQMIAENGRMLAERSPLSEGARHTVTDIDHSELAADRIVNKTFGTQAAQYRSTQTYRVIKADAPQPTTDTLLRSIDSHPFVPRNPETLDQRCEEIFRNMAHALASRAQEASSQAFVLGLSGGLDSTLALLTCMYACDIIGKPYDFIHTLTMPGLASSEQTQDLATTLAQTAGATHTIAPIHDLSNAVFGSIGHDGTTEDITYENTQARVRTLLLMNYANLHGGMVVGTGDMSENAQGWCTYNGDQMSMFNPNTSIPKTLVRHLVRWYADRRATDEMKPVLAEAAVQRVSPELKKGTDGGMQATDDTLGPDDLRDFFLYHQNRRREDPSKTGYLAVKAFEGVYTKDEIGHWLSKYLSRYTGSQWKRDVMPNGPKIGTVSLSPRGDLRMAPNTSQGWFGTPGTTVARV